MKNDIQKCLLYFDKDMVSGYLLENKKNIKIGNYEKFTNDSITEIWKWWIGATSYRKSKEKMDICILAESKLLIENLLKKSDGINFVNKSTWQLDQLKNFIMDFYPGNNYMLFGKEDVDKFEIISACISFYSEPIKKYIYVAENIVNDDKDNSSKFKKNIVNNVNSILYEEFNKITLKYEKIT